jgi:hypothetical protein
MVADCGLLAGLYGLGFFLFLPYYEQQLREYHLQQQKQRERLLHISYKDLGRIQM